MIKTLNKTGSNNEVVSVLIIEDDEQHRRYVSELLNTEGFSVNTAENGVEGLSLQLKNNYDLLITDIIMPDMEGLELIMKVQKNTPNTPIIAISGGGKNGITEYLEHAMLLGATQALSKPLDPTELIDMIYQLTK